MSSGDLMLHKVLVGVDGRSGGRDAIALARHLGSPDARLVLANVYDAGALSRGHGSNFADRRARAHALLARESVAAGVEVETVVTEGGVPGRALHKLVRRERASLLVVGSSHRGSIGRALLGDETLLALNGAPCAVAIAPRGYAVGRHELRCIGVGHDGSAESELGLQAALALARAHAAVVSVLAVVSLQSVPSETHTPLDWTDETERAIASERVRVGAIDGVSADVVYGDPGEELARFGAGLDLLVVGSRGNGRVGRLLNGSTSTYLARRAGCPLLVVPRSLLESPRSLPESLQSLPESRDEPLRSARGPRRAGRRAVGPHERRASRTSANRQGPRTDRT